MIRRWYIGLLFVIISTTVQAEHPPLTPVVFLDIQQGLSNNTVRCIFQDHNGFLWFGTRDGLNRYDGNTFTVFRHQFKDSNSLLSNYVLSLLEDNTGRIWIGTRQGLCIYDPLLGRFSTLEYTDPQGHKRPIDDVIKELCDDGHGDILIGTEETGLLLYPKGAMAAIPIPISQIPTSTQCGIHAIKADGDNIWVQVQKKGLCRFDPATRELHLVNTQLPLAGSLEIAAHTLWAGSGASLYRYDPTHNRFDNTWTLPAKSQDEIWVLRSNGKGGLLMGTVNGRVLTWNIAAGKALPQPLDDSTETLQYGTIYALCMAQDGSGWIGTAKGGIGVIDPQRSRFHTFSHLPGLAGSPADFVTCFAETPDSSLLVGTEGNGILLYDRHHQRFTHFGISRPSTDKVISLYSDNTGHVWAAAQGAGIDRIDLRTGHTNHYYCNKAPSGQETCWVWVVYGDREHNIWATTLRQVSLMGALYRFDPATDHFTLFDPNLSDIFALYEDHEDTLWGGNLSQLIEIDRTTRHHNYYRVGATVHCIYEDHKGALWLGTEGSGLLRFDRRRHIITNRYTTDEGLCNNTVNAILEDSTGALWLSTAYGLSRFNPATKRFRNYYESDGLQSNEFIYNSALALRSGEFAFGGIKGFNLFDPADITETREMPRLMLTGITVNGEPIQKDTNLVERWGPSQAQAIRVPYDKAFLSFDFTALEFSTPGEIAYAYYMEGWDRKWTRAGTQHQATYTHLEPGHYVFHVKNTNAEGAWNPTDITLGITILPPWYRSAWAYALYILVIAGLLYLYLHYKTRQTRLTYEIAMAKLTAEKQRAEHEKRISFFTNIAHEFRTPLTLIINPIKDLLKKNAGTGSEQAEMQVVHRNARRMLSLVDQLLLFRKADSGEDRLIATRLNLVDLGREVFLSFTQQARARDIHYTFDCTSPTLEIIADREKVEIILFNLVSNALKYTPQGGEVTVSIATSNNTIEISVADSGPGIPAETGDKIFLRFYQSETTGAAGGEKRPKPGFGIGLYLARQFALAHNGDLTYTSKAGIGTTFVLRLPANTANTADTGNPTTAPQEHIDHPGELFQELVTAELVTPGEDTETPIAIPAPLIDEKYSLLIIDDDQSLRQYIAAIFRPTMTVYEAEDGTHGLQQALEHLPDLVISDIRMQGINGIDVCKALKTDPISRHIPVILLTGTPTADSEMQGTQGGADLYLTKPFDKDLLRARVTNLLQSRNSFREALFNEITGSKPLRGISDGDKTFLDKCIGIIEQHLDEEDFAIPELATAMGVSHSSLYKKVKALTGQSLNAFIRQVRLRNAAILCINTELNVNEIAARVGIIDRTHFREQFMKVYGITAAEYIRKYRKPLSSRYTIKKNK